MAAQDWVSADNILILAGDETTAGTAASLTEAANAIFVSGFKVTPRPTEVQKQRLRDTHAASGIAIGNIDCDVELMIPFAGPPDPGASADMVLPDAFKPLKWAGVGITTTDEDVDTYDDRHTAAPNSDGQQATGTLEFWMMADGGTSWEMFQVTGVVFDLEITANNNEEAMFRYTGKGLFTIPTNPSAPSKGDYLSDPDDNLVAKNITYTVDSRTDDHTQFSFKLNNEIKPINSVNPEYGVLGHRLVNGQPTIELDEQYKLQSDYSFWSKLISQASFATSWTAESVNGAKYVFAAPNCQWGAPSDISRDDVVRRPGPIYCRDTASGSGDDAWSLYVERAS